MPEADELGAEAAVQDAAEVALAADQIELRQPVIRRHDRRERILQGLEALHARLQGGAGAERRIRVSHIAVLRQRAQRHLPHLAREVDEIAVVGYLVVIDLSRQVRTDRLRVLQRYAPSRFTEFLVVGQVFELQLPRIRALEIPHLVLELLAALRHVHRGKRRVELGRDVPVIRNSDFQAAPAVLRVIRREQSALAPALERKADIRRREHSVVEEAKTRVARAAFVRVIVELQLVGLEAPVLLPVLTGGEGPVEQPVAPLAEKFDALGAAARRALALQQVAGLLEHTAIVRSVVLQPRPEEAVGAALHPHPPLAHQAAELTVEAQLLAEDAQVIAPDFRPAARRDLEVAHALDRLGVDGRRSCGILAGGLRQGWRGGNERDGQRRKAVRHRATKDLFS